MVNLGDISSGAAPRPDTGLSARILLVVASTAFALTVSAGSGMSDGAVMLAGSVSLTSTWVCWVLLRTEPSPRVALVVLLVSAWPLFVLGSLLSGVGRSEYSSLSVVPVFRQEAEVSGALVWLSVFILAATAGLSRSFARSPPVQSARWSVVFRPLPLDDLTRGALRIAVLIVASLRIPSALDAGVAGSASATGLLGAALVPIIAVWARRGWLFSSLYLTFSLAVPEALTAGVQGAAAPILFLVFARVADRRPGRGAATVRRLALVLFPLLLIAVTLQKPEASGQNPSASSPGSALLTDLAPSPLISEALLSTRAQPSLLPSLASMGSRVIQAPIPRLIYPEKSLSYDFDLRDRVYPRLEGAIPISLVGTAGMLLGPLAVAIAGYVSGRLSGHAATMLKSSLPHRRSLGVIAVLFVLDVVRVGGLARELQSAVLLVCFSAVAERVWADRKENVAD